MSNESDTSPQMKVATSFSNLESQNVVILGKGLYGRALATHITTHAPQHYVTVVSRSTETTPADATASADIVILAVPASAFGTVLREIRSSLQPGVLVIDVSNQPLRSFSTKLRKESPALALARDVPQGVHVVKAFNTLSPQLLATPAALESRVPYASDENAAPAASAFISSLGFKPRHQGSLASAATEIEAIPHTLFPSWKGPVILSAVVWTWWILYSIMASYVIHGRKGKPSREWRKAPLGVFMSTTGETAMTMFAVTFLAGPLARLVQFARGSVSKPFPRWFTNWLDARKELGLAAFFFAVAHGIAGAISEAHLDDDSEWKESAYFTLGIMYVFLNEFLFDS